MPIHPMRTFDVEVDIEIDLVGVVELMDVPTKESEANVIYRVRPGTPATINPPDLAEPGSAPEVEVIATNLEIIRRAYITAFDKALAEWVFAEADTDKYHEIAIIKMEQL